MKKDLKSLIVRVLQGGYLMSLGTIDSEGVWVSDVIYVYDENLNIYWMSDPDTRHSKSILHSNEVAGAITVSGKGQDDLGIQLNGTISKIDGPRFDLTAKHFSKRGKAIPSEHEDVLQGDSWYMIKPKKIDIICEEKFGFKKQFFIV